MAEYFEPIAAPTGPESAQQFANRIDTQFNEAVARDNLLADDAAMDRRVIAGAGRLENEGAEVSVVSGVARVSNGFFYAGPGANEDDESHFEGLRLKQIASELGYLELLDSDAPPLSKPGGAFGYMSWYGDVLWFDTRQTSPTQIEELYGRWCLGKVVTDGVGAVSVDTVYTDSIPNLATMKALIDALTTRVEMLESAGGGEGGGGGGGGGGGFAYAGVAPWLPDPADDRQTYIVIAAMLAALRAELMALIRDGGVRPQQTDLAKLIGENAIMRQEIAKCQLFLRKISGLLDLDLMVELGLERSQSANIVGIPGGTEIYGAGGSVGATFPDHLGASTLTMNDDGTVEP